MIIIKNMVYDVVIIGAGAAGLFAGINLDKNIKKIILEKNKKPGIKVLLSGGERANVSNMDIDPMRDYFTQNKKFLLSVFSKYTNWDIMSFFAENNVSIVEEDRSRLILESGDSKELLACLLRKAKDNKCELKTEEGVEKIIRNKIGELDKGYMVVTSTGKKYEAKTVIVSCGGKSFFHVGTTGDGYKMAEDLGVNVTETHPCLCGVSTKQDLKEISGVSAKVDMKCIDTKTGKEVYGEFGPILFTHFGVSGPIIHNLSAVTGEYLNTLGLEKAENDKYLCDNFVLEISIPLENATKSLIKFFELTDENNEINLDLHSLRSLREAKATSGGVDTKELDQHMQSKKHPGLYFIGEVVDVTGKTGGFNLQWAWSSGFVAADHINAIK
ncbi:MAG: aminoacetone oxidase family FAD-binding enzyme [Candidatus Gracilibacteria bacterium]|nr:aminoacetone oxidase family FAD-binding enzyme [Candidatus Gracilibacteria bacterium]